MAFVEEPSFSESSPEAGALPDGATPNNRPFIIAVVVLVVVFVIGLICVGVGLFVIAPRNAAARATANAEILNANATTLAQQTQISAVTNTPTLEPSPTLALVASDTPVLQLPATDTPVPLPTDTPTIAPILPSDTPTIVSSDGSATPTALGGITSTIKAPITGTVSAPGGSATPTPLVGGLRTSTPTTRAATPTQLPGTGFADDAGVPQLIIIGLVLIAVVIFARQLRLRLR